METFTVRIIKTDGSVSLLDKAFSQTVEMLRGVSSADRDIFWDGAEAITLPSGENVKLVDMDKIKKATKGHG